jgi:hypothetical protein
MAARLLPSCGESSPACIRFRFRIPRSWHRQCVVLDAANDTGYAFGATSCTSGEILALEVEVTSRLKNAVASGKAAAYCLG